MPINEPDPWVRGRDPEIVAAVDALASKIAPDFDLFDEAWAQFSCQEIELLATVFRVAGYATFAASVIEGHALHDEPGDDHYEMSKED